MEPPEALRTEWMGRMHKRLGQVGLTVFLGAGLVGGCGPGDPGEQATAVAGGDGSCRPPGPPGSPR